VLVADVTWIPTDGGSYQSGITVWLPSDDKPAFLPLPRGKELSWVFRGPRLCIGSYDEAGKMVKCPEDSVLLRGGVRCGPCAAMDMNDPCIRCDGRICTALEGRRIQCESTDYVVYMVIFNDQTAKVGVSTKRRALTRWIEQGADYGGVLQELQGGKRARRLENRLGRRKELTKQVHSSRKIRSLSSKLQPVQAQSLADSLLEKINDPFIGTGVELEDLSKYYNLSPFERPPQPWKKRSEPVHERSLVGTVIGMKGPLLITSIGSSYAATDLKQVIGYSIDLDSDITVVTQTGLSDFF
jgi:hypothetical protein